MLKIYNTLSRKKENFKPLKKGEVGMYCCGPTVYNYQHIGNLRTYIFEDILKRVLKYNGYKVKHVINITDVGHLISDADQGEDKMMKALLREGLELNESSMLKLAEKYTKVFKEDFDKLNLQIPDEWPKATEHVKEMEEMVKKLIEKGYAYETSTAIYFDITKNKDYGKLARLNLDKLEAGFRIEPDPEKRNPLDFALWFKAIGNHSKHVMQWESKWGKGFPGWHIECSAMSIKHLGKQFDIHCGGIDHIPVHHTNEIAQTEGVTGKKWVNYWLHGDFLVMNKGKMSKSSGEFLTLQLLIDKGHDPLSYRYFCLGAHYKTNLTFSYEGLEGAQNALNKLKEKVIYFKTNPCSFPNKRLEKKHLKEFEEKINDDMNMPEALAVTWGVIKDKKIGNDERLKLLLKFDEILGLNISDMEEEIIKLTPSQKQRIQEREEARKDKDWKMADKIRDEFLKEGVILEDSKSGIKCRIINK